MKHLKNVFTKAFEQMDMFKVPNTLRVFQQDNYRSCRLGFLSTLLMIFFIYVFVNQTVKLYSFQKVQVNFFNTGKNTNQTKGYIPMMAVCLDFLPTQQFEQMFQFYTSVYKTGELFQQIPMKPCTPQQWKLLGEGYQNSFDQYQLKMMFCPQKEGGFNISQTFRSNKLDYVTITMKSCNPVNNSNCNPDLISQYLTGRTRNGGSAQIWVYILDQVLNPEKKDPVSYFINTDAKTQLTNKFGGAIGLQYSSYNIQTDVSSMPYQNIQKVQGSLVDEARSYPIEYNNQKTDRLAVISFSMNKKNQIIKRKFGKLDDVLSYAGGLFSIIITFLSFFSVNFNKYRYEIYVGNQFHQEQKKKIKMGLLMYIKYSIFDWINLLFVVQEQNKQKRDKWGSFWNDCIEIDKRRQQGIKWLQVSNIFRLMKNLQYIDIELDNSQKVFLEKLKKIKQKEGLINLQLLRYYDQLIKIKSPQIYSKQQQSQVQLNREDQEINNKEQKDVISLSEFSKIIQRKICNGLFQLKQDQKNQILKQIPHLIAKRLEKLIPPKLINDHEIKLQ